MNKNRNVAFLSFVSRLIKVLIGPLVLLIISKKLTSIELGYYYTFFSLIAMQQLMELGIGHTIKQFISHSCFYNNGELTLSSNRKISAYFYFSIRWFRIIGMFMLFVIGPIGFFYYGADVEAFWFWPWVLLIISTFLNIQITPYMIYLESIQKQELFFKINIVTCFVNSIVLCLLIYKGFGLYSIGYAYLSMFFVSTVIIYKLRIKSCMMRREDVDSFKLVFREIWPLLSRVSIIWGVGYFFWNGFNLISFKIFDPIYAGKIVFLISLASTGFFVAESIIQGQMTIFSKMIADKKIEASRNLFNKYRYISITVLISGYLLFFFVKYLVPEFYIFNKLPNNSITIQVFIFYVILILFTTNNNYIRCFKVEPFLKISVFNSFFIPVSYLVGSYMFKGYGFLCSTFFLIISLYMSRKIQKDFLKKYL